MSRTVPFQPWLRPPAWLLLSALAAACGDADPEPPWPGLATGVGGLQVEQARIELPTVTFGEATHGVYRLHNAGQDAVMITRIGPANCDCTELTLKFPERPDDAGRHLRGLPVEIMVQPGERAEIEVTFDTSRNRQPVSRKVDSFVLAVADTPGMVLEYVVDVWTPFWMEPWSLDLGQIGSRQRATAFASVKGHDDENFQLLVPSEVNGWSVEVHELEGAAVSTFNVQVTAPPELPYGTFSEEFKLRSDLPGSPEMQFVLRGTVVEDVYWSPLRLVFRPDGKTRKAAVLKSRSGNLPLHLLDLTVEGLPVGFLQIEAETVTEGKEFRIWVDLLAVPDERKEGTLVLLTDYVDRPRIEIPIVLLPQV